MPVMPLGPLVSGTRLVIVSRTISPKANVTMAR
ncbi:MAG: hypothetical protein XD74_0110 [Actinobacteria bacterium 66_15]|nr:MAG: hypothetical protein XD74_0110 [Actinobacteria bacterium 66_15]